jgi:transcription-repair coupling factor (superfamily II helicase)
LDSGFFYQTENVLVVSDADVYSAKRKKVRKSRVNPDLFAEQMATLKIDDFVIHRDHGTGRYKGLESINLGGNETDFLVIEFKDQDKVYVPVYKINLIQKHADSNAEIKVSDLKSKRFSLEKNKARNSVKRLAFDLIKLQAERKSKETYDFKFYEDEFAEFEHSFPFKETPDQAKAVNDIIEDLKKPHPMERLICGDVGFGKTEVAMRAAYLNILNNKQVAILVPTTVLSFQHFQSFQKRFKDFPVKIDYISRFKKGAELKKTLHKLESGQIDIIIGTHKLLSKDIHFKDLGLLIIDEEHRFGVGHKEKLKLIKNNVDCITMTATPIPRTLQLSFLGIRDLSLIQTPPPNRQAIKTNILREDKQNNT